MTASSASPTATRRGLPTRDLSKFTGAGYDKGRGTATQVAWLLTWGAVGSRWWCSPGVRASILRAFGASIGRGTVIRHNVRIHWPWKLAVGDHSWIGEGAYLLNLEPITIGRNVCISQQVMLCTGSHDRRSPTFEYDNGPITVEDLADAFNRITVPDPIAAPT